MSEVVSLAILTLSLILTCSIINTQLYLRHQREILSSSGNKDYKKTGLFTSQFRNINHKKVGSPVPSKDKQVTQSYTTVNPAWC